MADSWVITPTADAERCGDTFAKWRSRGFSTAALVDGNTPDPLHADVVVRLMQYRGIARAFNLLADQVIDRGAQWFLPLGDDQFPDQTRNAAQIADECADYFAGTFGVMNAVGDHFGNIMNCCDAAWVGREWIARHGLFHTGYQHFFCTEELQHQAIAAGVFWQRPDVVVYHDHFFRDGRPMTDYQTAVRNGPWKMDSDLFRARKAKGFP